MKKSLFCSTFDLKSWTCFDNTTFLCQWMNFYTQLVSRTIDHFIEMGLWVFLIHWAFLALSDTFIFLSISSISSEDKWIQIDLKLLPSPTVLANSTEHHKKYPIRCSAPHLGPIVRLFFCPPKFKKNDFEGCLRPQKKLSWWFLLTYFNCA